MATAPSGSVLVLTSPHDVTTDLVLRILAERQVPVVRLDPGPDLLAGAALTASYRTGDQSGTLRTPSRELDLTRVRSVWTRRPSPFEGPAGPDLAERKFAASQSLWGAAWYPGVPPWCPLREPSMEQPGSGVQAGPARRRAAQRLLGPEHADHQRPRRRTGVRCLPDRRSRLQAAVEHAVQGSRPSEPSVGTRGPRARDHHRRRLLPPSFSSQGGQGVRRTPHCCWQPTVRGSDRQS